MNPFKKLTLIEVGRSKRWTKSHARFRGILGASFCRRVDLDEVSDLELLSTGKNVKKLTCMGCLQSAIIQLIILK